MLRSSIKLESNIIVGLYLSWAQDIWKELSLVREDQDGRTSSVPVVTPVANAG